MLYLRPFCGPSAALLRPDPLSQAPQNDLWVVKHGGDGPALITCHPERNRGTFTGRSFGEQNPFGAKLDPPRHLFRPANSVYPADACQVAPAVIIREATQ
jgi:hypothetical protein